MLRDPAERRRFAKEWLLPALGLLILVTTVIGVSAIRFPQISRFDEQTHIDMMLRGSRFELIREGDRLLDETIRAQGCRGRHDDLGTPPCHLEPYPPGPQNYNTFHPPIYYVTTGVLARLTVAVTPVQDIITAARLIGILWLGAGLIVTFAMMRLLGVRLWVAFSASAFIALTPTIIHMNSIVNNDATSVLAGSSLLLVVVLYERGRAPLWLVFLITLLGAGMKVMNAAAAIVAVAYLLVRFVQARWTSEARSQFWRGTAVMAAAVALVQLGWSFTQSLRASDPEYVSPFSGSETVLKLDELLRKIPALIPPTDMAFIPAEVYNNGVRFWYSSSSLALVGVMFALALMAIARSRDRALGLATVIGLAGTALTVAVFDFYNSGRYPQIMHPRYALSVLPAIAVCGALVMDRDRVTRVTAYAAVVLGAVIMIPSYAGWY